MVIREVNMAYINLVDLFETTSSLHTYHNTIVRLSRYTLAIDIFNNTWWDLHKIAPLYTIWHLFMLGCNFIRDPMQQVWFKMWQINTYDNGAQFYILVSLAILCRTRSAKTQFVCTFKTKTYYFITIIYSAQGMEYPSFSLLWQVVL